MICRLPTVVASTLLLAVCGAAPAMGQEKQLAYGLSPADVESGFIMAVMDGCTNAAETGRTLDQLNPYRIIRDTNRGAALAPKAGYTAWAPGIGVGIVRIDDGPGGCEVFAHGASVPSTFDAVASALLAKGYVAQAGGSSASGAVRRELVRDANGRSVKVVLSGDEAGASGNQTGFSQLSAVITAR